MFPLWPPKRASHFGGSLPWHDHRQQRAAPPGTVQSGGKCGQIRAGWRTDTALCGVEWSRYCHHRGQSGTLYPAGVTGADLRAFFRADTPAPGNWGVSAWGWPWSGPLQKSTAAAYGWRKIRLAGIDFWSGFRQYVHEGEPSFPAMLLAAKLESFLHNF